MGTETMKRTELFGGPNEGLCVCVCVESGWGGMGWFLEVKKK